MSSPSLNFLGVKVTIPLEDMGEQAITESWTQDGPSADVWFKCPWDSRYTVITYLRGGVLRSGKSFTYLRPSTYPDSPNLFCTSINQVHGRKPRTLTTGVLPGWVHYQYAYIQAHFSTPTWDAIGTTVTDPSNIPMTTTKFRGSAEIFAPPTGAFYYTSGSAAGKKVAESSVGYVRSRVEISMTRHMIPYPILDTLMYHVGCVNNAPMTVGDRAFPRGCLLFAAFDTDPVADPGTGQKCWDYTFTFMGNYNIEWNEFMDPYGDYVLVNTAAGGGGDYPFEYIDLTALFGESF